jgi:hypothetical protein
MYVFLRTYRQSLITDAIWVVKECSRLCLSEILHPVALRQNTANEAITVTNLLHFSFPSRCSIRKYNAVLAYYSGLKLPIQHTSAAHSFHCCTQSSDNNALLLVKIRMSSVDIRLSSLRFSWILTWLTLFVELFLLKRSAPLYVNCQANSGALLRPGNLSCLLPSIGSAFPTHLFLELCM